MLERRCMQVIKKVEWLKGSLLSFFLSLLRAIIVSLIILNIHVTRFKKEFPCIWAIFWVQCMHRLSGKPLTSTKGPPHLLLFFYLQTHHCTTEDLLKMWWMPVTFESKKGTFKSSTSFFIAEYYVQRSGVCDAELFLMRHFSECLGMWTTSWSDTSVFNRPLTHSLWSTGTKKLP